MKTRPSETTTTQKEIIKKAIEKAIKHGWESGIGNIAGVTDHGANRITVYFERGNKVLFSIIFSHDFAKAFWGDAPNIYMSDKGSSTVYLVWQYHLQKMVLGEDPITYLEQFL